MKKIFLSLVTIALMASCSTDDSNESPENTIPETETETESDIETDDDTQDPGNGLLRLVEVDAVNDLVTITNFGDGSLEVGDYFLCLGPGTYAAISGLTDDSTNLAPNESVSLNYDVNEMADGLGVFTVSEFGSSDPNILLDYVQWGAANQARSDQAVAAGRWDDVSNFASGVNVFTFDGNVTDFGSDFWEGEEEQNNGPAVLRILSVDATNDQVTLTNFGGETIDIDNYWLCLGPGTYARIGAITTEDTNLEAEETITLSYDVNPSQDGLSVFSINSFGSSDPTVLVDYVQWGAASQARSGQAVTAGRWGDVNNFVPTSTTYNYNGGATDVGVTFW